MTSAGQNIKHSFADSAFMTQWRHFYMGMENPMLRHIRALLILLAMVMITLVLCSTLFVIWTVKWLIPFRSIKKHIHELFHRFPDYWEYATRFVLSIGLPTQYQVEGLEDFASDEWYLLICNHTSWTDILVLQRIFLNKIPSLRFFMKQELLWQLPVAAQACKILGFPFVKRYSREFLEKNPQYKGKDIEATRKALQEFNDFPITIINFSEGHRFTRARHSKQNSPYQLLLKPRAGGAAFALAAMENHVKHIINVTILYPQQDLSFWDYLSARVDKVTIKIEKLSVTDSMRGDYESDREYRTYLQNWINHLWHEKDLQLIEHYQKRSS